MLKTVKREIKLDETNKDLLDGTSYMLSCLYNALHTACENDYFYKENNHTLYKGLLNGKYNLRDYTVHLKKFMSCENVYSSLVKNTALQLTETYKRFFNGISGYPKKKYQNNKWFSLHYDEPNKSPNIIKGILNIPLGKDDNNQKIVAKATFVESYKYPKNIKIKNSRITRDNRGRYYLIQCIEAPDVKEKENLSTWVSIDMNHKNFFVAITDKGISYEFVKSNIVKYFDKQIDKMKSKLSYTKKGSIRHKRFSKTLSCLYIKRKEQVKQYLYTLSHYLVKNYDTIIIGDYTPTNDTATSPNMKRSMLNQEHIGMFRSIVKWVSEKSGKRYLMVDEYNTTKECCKTGILTKRSPDVRDWVINFNGKEEKVVRDVNSGINIAKKAGYLVNEHLGWDISEIDNELSYRYGKKVRLRSIRPLSLKSDRCDSTLQ